MSIAYLKGDFNCMLTLFIRITSPGAVSCHFCLVVGRPGSHAATVALDTAFVPHASVRKPKLMESVLFYLQKNLRLQTFHVKRASDGQCFYL